MANSLSTEQREVLVAEMLSHWRREESSCISMEPEIYSEFFSFLQPQDSVHDRNTGNILFLLFPRKEAVDEIKRHYQLREKSDGSPLRRNTK